MMTVGNERSFQRVRWTKKTILCLTFLLILSGVAVFFCTMDNSRKRAFKDAMEYWSTIADAEMVDPPVVAEFTIPLMNRDGVEFLMKKMDEGTRFESKVAVLQLICLRILLSDGIEPNSLVAMTDHSVLVQKAVEYNREEENPTISGVLSRFAEAPVGRDRVRVQPVSDSEWWEIRGNRFKVFETSLSTRGTNESVFCVMIDRSSLATFPTTSPSIEDMRLVALYAVEHGYVERAEMQCNELGFRSDIRSVQVFLSRKTPYGIGGFAGADFSLAMLEREVVDPSASSAVPVQGDSADEN